ncbi:MAG: dephospho-CoA kinase [Oscillospiraceae bacterium]|nr:dephospho-CoA kinase [Oscillospiraceae bacterium]
MAVNEKVKVVGLTGMSGAGKSTACKVFKAEGFEIIDCDLICRSIVEKGEPCLCEIAKAFGTAVLNKDGSLDRAEMGRIIFSDDGKRRLLNGIMYPYVSYIIINTIAAMDNGFALLDAPTLFESGIDSICDSIVSIVADKEILLSRIESRDLISREQAENRLASQHDTGFFSERSNYTIENNGSSEEFFSEIMKTIKKIKEGK